MYNCTDMTHHYNVQCTVTIIQNLTFKMAQPPPSQKTKTKNLSKSFKCSWANDLDQSNYCHKGIWTLFAFC